MQERDQFLRQIDKLAGSQTVSGSEPLSRFLRYLADWAIGHPSQHPKEYQIAIQVGRPTDFDPQVDSTIRVQAGRLRQKIG